MVSTTQAEDRRQRWAIPIAVWLKVLGMTSLLHWATYDGCKDRRVFKLETKTTWTIEWSTRLVVDNNTERWRTRRYYRYE